MTTSREMTTGPALPLILNFTLPLLLGNLLQQTYSLVDAAIVGQFLGIDALAGVGASSSVIFLILGFCNGCCCGFGIPVAQRFGARDYADMRRYVANALRLAVGISVTVAIVTSIWCADILHAMRTPTTSSATPTSTCWSPSSASPAPSSTTCCRTSSAHWATAARPSGSCSSRRC